MNANAKVYQKYVPEIMENLYYTAINQQSRIEEDRGFVHKSTPVVSAMLENFEASLKDAQRETGDAFNINPTGNWYAETRRRVVQETHRLETAHLMLNNATIKHGGSEASVFFTLLAEAHKNKKTLDGSTITIVFPNIARKGGLQAS